ncbi:hypothetical protein PLICRDRAFT_571252 [Plicaturopsis crispa FD-325 SS-3]|nr:hypothetical protein PLICRDRAFT_571252 [Plicaturopsis crispa FD-325 SS-3]
MVHVRINERESNPNPHCNFITPLPSDPADESAARELLRALAAQVRPVMKAHGFVVNSLEEYEYNNVFAGRNWNNGETIELVLRRSDGSFQDTSWLMSTLCHELAHIKHMNHGPAFQALWARLRADVRALQQKGYYGDGYYSSGTRLADSARVRGKGLEVTDMPEYMCGGAQTRTRPARARRARTNRAPRGPSLHTGAQTARKRKAGARVTAKGAFGGEGSALVEDTLGEGGKGKAKGTGFGKQAASKRAREERAKAAERRMAALAGPSREVQEDDDHDGDSEEDVDVETDADRRRALLDSAHASDSAVDEKADKGANRYEDDFIWPSAPPAPEEVDGRSKGKGKQSVIELEDDDDIDKPPPTKRLRVASPPALPSKSSKRTAGMVQTEVAHRKKEALGLVGPGRKLRALSQGQASDSWTCHICTLINISDHLACDACGTERDVTTSMLLECESVGSASHGVFCMASAQCNAWVVIFGPIRMKGDGIYGKGLLEKAHQWQLHRIVSRCVGIMLNSIGTHRSP